MGGAFQLQVFEGLERQEAVQTSRDLPFQTSSTSFLSAKRRNLYFSGSGLPASISLMRSRFSVSVSSYEDAPRLGLCMGIGGGTGGGGGDFFFLSVFIGGILIIRYSFAFNDLYVHTHIARNNLLNLTQSLLIAYA